MIRMFYLLLAAGVTVSASAQVPSMRRPTAAQLYSYEVQAEKFEPAYRSHLDWHRANSDHLTWYAWNVIGGERPGRFVDGTFGSTLGDIDRRPNPAEDARHFAANVAAFAKPLATTTWQLWPEVSTIFPLEDKEPSPVLDVLTIEVAPAAATRFEATLAALAARRHVATKLGWTWYRAVAGQDLHSYMLMVPRKNWAEMENRGTSLSALAASAFGTKASETAPLDAMVSRISSEVWRYRADLTYFPGN